MHKKHNSVYIHKYAYTGAYLKIIVVFLWYTLVWYTYGVTVVSIDHVLLYILIINICLQYTMHLILLYWV